MFQWNTNIGAPNPLYLPTSGYPPFEAKLE